MITDHCRKGNQGDGVPFRSCQPEGAGESASRTLQPLFEGSDAQSVSMHAFRTPMATFESATQVATRPVYRSCLGSFAYGS
jgi:hypothetical protein